MPKDKILVVNGRSYAYALDGLGSFCYDNNYFFNNINEFMLVLFTGGSDVHPVLYGDKSPKHFCSSNISRDIEELKIFNAAKKHGILMTGICRGVQFLNVASGGKMMHHINGHAGSMHKMHTSTGDTISINSLHHQMVIPPDSAIIIGWADNISNIYIGENDEEVVWKDKEVETVIFPETKSFGVQYHPEMMNAISQGYSYFHDLVHKALTTTWENFIKHNVGEKQYAKKAALP